VNVYREHPIEWNGTTVARLWNWYAKTSPFNELYFARRFGDLILRESGLPLHQPFTVLDFGCGPGFLWDHLRALNARWRYVGADFSRDSTQQLAQRAANNANFAAAHHLERLPVPLANASIDAVFLVEVVEHVGDEHLDSILDDMARVLRPGGRLIITTPNDEDLAASTRLCPECGAIFHEWQHVRTWNAASLSAHASRFGFVPMRVRPHDFYARGPARMAFNTLRRWVTGVSRPHLLGVFAR